MASGERASLSGREGARGGHVELANVLLGMEENDVHLGQEEAGQCHVGTQTY